MEPSDEALLDAMAGGDAQAATVLVRRHQARVFGLCLAVVGVRALAEEVAQDTFVRAWRFAGTI
ncbi:MAG TPA: sigma factor [Kribbella sp.]|nr:sigma factor [Kribbella sp.]